MTRRHLERRHRVADLLDAQTGVVSRRQLRQRGIDRWAIRDEVAAGRWVTWGRQTVAIAVTDRAAAARWSALFEAGCGARLDGVTSLQENGLTGWRSDAIEVAVPHSKHHTRRPGIIVHAVCGIEEPVPAGIPRSPVIPATLRATQRAGTDLQATTLLAMVVQQRLTSADRLLDAWQAWGRARRKAVLDLVVHDICNGAHALGELDFTGACRRYGLPPPERQAVLTGPGGRIYRDARWPGLTVEIDGVQHWAGLATVDDALRANQVAMTGDMVLHIPVLGMRLKEPEFMGQVVRAFYSTRGATVT